jgi:transposase
MVTGRLSVSKVSELLGMARSTIYGLIGRFKSGGLKALEDQRKYNGVQKADAGVDRAVKQMLRQSPQDYGWSRPTWTRELLIGTLREKLGVRISVSTVGRVLQRLGARLGRPRPVVGCPWTAARRKRRLRELQQLVEAANADEVVLYQDEVDIHLNPKVGVDWMLPGQQKLVITPGQNKKRYLAGALDARTGELVWTEGDRKHSAFFCQHVDELMERYREKQRVHLILDNYIIHKSKRTQRHLQRYGDRLVLHFLPPYCPNANRIERRWRDLHAEVTRNHRCPTIDALMEEVRHYLSCANEIALALNSTNETDAIAA